MSSRQPPDLLYVAGLQLLGDEGDEGVVLEVEGRDANVSLHLLALDEDDALEIGGVIAEPLTRLGEALGADGAQAVAEVEDEGDQAAQHALGPALVGEDDGEGAGGVGLRGGSCVGLGCGGGQWGVWTSGSGTDQGGPAWSLLRWAR